LLAFPAEDQRSAIEFREAKGFDEPRNAERALVSFRFSQTENDRLLGCDGRSTIEMAGLSIF
jgi:hypothetical protein